MSTRIDRQEGISYTEFSYMLLQSFDFLKLRELYGCTLQAGGSDQWGNITAGVELIRRVRGERGFGLVYPLVTTADGSKLGKTERGTIWLDAKKTSPYRFYQYWLNQPDAEAVAFLSTSLGSTKRRLPRWHWRRRSSPNAARRSARWHAKSRGWCMAARRSPMRRRRRRHSSAAISRACRLRPSRISSPRRRLASYRARVRGDRQADPRPAG